MKGSLIIVGFFCLGVCVRTVPRHSIRHRKDRHQLLHVVCPDVQRGIKHRQRPSDTEKLPEFESEADISSDNDDTGNRIGSRFGQPVASAPERSRLYGCRSRFRLLFAIKHLHYRIQGSGTGHHCLAVEYPA